MKFEGVIFDLDGTLIDSLLDLANSGNSLLQKYGWPVHAADDYRHFIGSGAPKLVERIIPAEYRDKERIEELTLEFKALYRDNCDITSKAYPLIKEVVLKLKEMGIRMAILSNKPHELTVRCVKKMLPESCFDIIMGQVDGEPRKPDPKVALDIAREMEIEPSKMVFIGDMEIDIITAVKGGFEPVAVSWGLRNKAELKEFGAKRIIDSPGEIIGLFC
ncbi:MAG: HAD family hydrolase [Bacteroidota bacterium]